MSFTGMKARFCGCIGFCTPPVCAHGKINNPPFPKAVWKCPKEEYKYWYKNVRHFEEYRISKCAVENTFAHSRKAPFSFVISVCPSARIIADPNLTDFHEIWYCGLLWKFVEKHQIWSKSDKKYRTVYKKTKFVADNNKTFILLLSATNSV